MNEGEIRMLALLNALISKSHAVVVSVEGMKAANAQDAIQGHAPSFKAADFAQASIELNQLAVRMMEDV